MTDRPWTGTEVPEPATLDRLFSKTKGQIFLHSKCAGFLGSLLCDHDYVWSEDAKFGTAWCNGQTIGFNPEFFMWMTPASRLTVLVHELMHTAFDHMSRIGKSSGRCPDIWNQAADHVINNLLKDWGFDFSQLMEIQPCIDPQYRGMSTEEVYELLPKPPVGQPMPAPGSGPPMGNDLQPPPGPGAEADIKAKQVRAIQIAHVSEEAGMIPGEIHLILEKFLNPILPWEVLLSRFYTELSQDDFSWKRPSRRYETEYLPSLDGDSKLEHLSYYLDVSGSVSDEEILRFFSEVKHIHSDHQPKKISIITFDTEIQNELEIRDDDPFDKVGITGRGGTSLDPVYHHIRKHKPTAAVIFSDLHCHPMGMDPGVPVVWIVLNNPAALVKFGKKVNINVDSRSTFTPPAPGQTVGPYVPG